MYLAVDQKFIPHRFGFQQQNFIHDILVYGFNTDQKTFNIIGFDEHEKYVCQQIDFSLLDMAIKSANEFFPTIRLIMSSSGLEIIFL